MCKLPWRISPWAACRHTADLPFPRRLCFFPTHTVALSFLPVIAMAALQAMDCCPWAANIFPSARHFQPVFFSVGYISLCLPSNFLQYFSLAWAHVLALSRELPALESFPEKVHHLRLHERVSLGLNLLFLSITIVRRGQGVLGSKMNSLFCFALLGFLFCKLEIIIKHCHQFLYFWQWCFTFLVLSLAYFPSPACEIKICNLLVLICHNWLCAQVWFLFPLAPTFVQGFCLRPSRPFRCSPNCVHVVLVAA